MEARRDRGAGTALGAVLGGRDSADQDARGRAALLALVRLYELGALTFERGAVHGAEAVAEPSTVGTPLGPAGTARGAVRPGGGRVVLDGHGAVVRAGLQTAPAYNMGQSVCIPGDAE